MVMYGNAVESFFRQMLYIHLTLFGYDLNVFFSFFSNLILSLILLFFRLPCLLSLYNIIDFSSSNSQTWHACSFCCCDLCIIKINKVK